MVLEKFDGVVKTIILINDHGNVLSTIDAGSLNDMDFVGVDEPYRVDVNFKSGLVFSYKIG